MLSRYTELILVAVAAIFPTSGMAQGVQTVSAFEVVSVKALEDCRPTTARPRSDPGRLSYPSVRLVFLIMQAYDLRHDQIHGPSWIDNQCYSVEAKIPEGALQGQIPQMLQGFLIDRFGLKIRRETRNQLVYALLVGKDGPKLKKSEIQNDGSGRGS